MKIFLKIGILSLFFFSTSISLQANRCDSKVSKKSLTCSTHISTTLNKPLAANSIKISKAKLLEKRKYDIDEMDRNYYVCPACHM